MRVVQARFRGESSGGQSVLSLDLLLFFAELNAEYGFREILIAIEISDKLRPRPRKYIAAVNFRHVKTSWRDQSKSGQRGLVAGGKFRRDPSTQGKAHDVDFLQAELFDEIKIEVGQVGDIVEPGRCCRSPKTRV